MKKINCNDAIRIKILREAGFDYRDGWTVAIKQGKKGTTERVLANFLAWPVCEVLVDDGSEQKRFVDVVGISASGVALKKVRLSYANLWGTCQRCSASTGVWMLLSNHELKMTCVRHCRF